jgi:sec-independent protein translocase protein TatA
MGISFGHILVVLLLVLVLFGAGKLPQVMGDLGRGLRNFKDGLKEDKTKALSSDDSKAE